jgi:hypothetical protein
MTKGMMTRRKTAMEEDDEIVDDHRHGERDL